MKSQEEKSKRGGKRPGAGRKSIYGVTTNINFRIDSDLRDYLVSQPNRSRFINESIRLRLEQIQQNP
jgi:hypothetical protein